MKQAQKVPGYPIAIIKIVASSNAEDANVRHVAAVMFKNIVKFGWEPDEVSTFAFGRKVFT